MDERHNCSICRAKSKGDLFGRNRQWESIFLRSVRPDRDGRNLARRFSARVRRLSFECRPKAVRSITRAQPGIRTTNEREDGAEELNIFRSLRGCDNPIEGHSGIFS